MMLAAIAEKKKQIVDDRDDIGERSSGKNNDGNQFNWNFMEINHINVFLWQILYVIRRTEQHPSGTCANVPQQAWIYRIDGPTDTAAAEIRQDDELLLTDLALPCD